MECTAVSISGHRACMSAPLQFGGPCDAALESINEDVVATRAPVSHTNAVYVSSSVAPLSAWIHIPASRCVRA